MCWHCSADGKYEVSYKPNVVIHSEGEVLWIPPAIYRSSCPISVKYCGYRQPSTGAHVQSALSISRSTNKNARWSSDLGRLTPIRWLVVFISRVLRRPVKKISVHGGVSSNLETGGNHLMPVTITWHQVSTISLHILRKTFMDRDFRPMSSSTRPESGRRSRHFTCIEILRDRYKLCIDKAGGFVEK